MGKGLYALGASWAVLEAFFFILVFGVVFKSALGGIWLGFGLDFNGFWKDFGKVLGSQKLRFSHFFRYFFEANFKGIFGRLKNRKKSPTRGADTEFWSGPAECAESGGEIERGKTRSRLGPLMITDLA